jgi:type II secretory pathway pseudopilin PulG
MKPPKKKRHFGLRGNQGSTMITVLVTMALITVLGTVLLFTSYTGMQMKTAELLNKENFYSAESAVNEIRAGLQQAVSDCIQTANRQTLENYSVAVSSSANDYFKASFLTALYHWSPSISKDPTDTSQAPIFYSSYGTYGTCYQIDLMKSYFISSGNQANVTCSAALSSATYGTLTVSPDSVTLKGLTVQYIDQKTGYETNITTDICISFPSVAYSLSDLVQTNLQSYSTIANTALVQEAGSGQLTLTGNSYAGKLSLSGAGNSLTIGSTSTPTQLITGGAWTNDGAIDINDSFGFNVSSNATIWAKRITLSGANSSATLNGTAYVADDLELAGASSSASLSGKYYGFGSSVSLTDAGNSSSILANGRNTALTFNSTLTTLVLAGQSFINTGTLASGNSDVLTGESISTKNDQLAYLIPISCFQTYQSTTISSNPAVFATNSVPDADTLKGCVNTSAKLWTGGPSLSNYDGTIVQLVYRPMTDSSGTTHTLVYFYMQFSDKTKASTYFRDYFQANKDNIKQYMNLYSQTLSMNSANPNLSGNGVYYDSSGIPSLISPTSTDNTSLTNSLSKMYQNLCTTLSSEKAGSGSVFSYIVNTSALSSLSDETLFTDDSGNVVGMIVKNDCKLSDFSKYPNLKVIISTKDVTVNQDFTGLIITDGTIHLNKSISLDQSNKITPALQAKAGREPLLNYLNITTASTGSSVGTGASVKWDLNQLVSYQNWTKQ